MLKLPKGLKKKKKDKKSKKNQELFTEEELEQYKREQRARQVAEEAEREKELQEQQQQQQSQEVASKSKTDDEEWSKFNRLTTGIDSILKKTQGDLDRIKEQSFFQRVGPKKQEPKKPEKKEKPKTSESPEETSVEDKEALKKKEELDKLKRAVVELSESEPESEQGDDIFDTNYIYELASGNVPLAYVPESPDEVDDGPDPFDTTYADKVIKGPEVSKRGKKIVNIGSAVEVLTGRVEKVTTASALKRPRRRVQNLLLESFDKDQDVDEIETVGTLIEDKPILTLLDDPADEVADVPIDLSTSLHLAFQQQKQAETESETEKKDDFRLEEFEKDEFDDLATESLTKKEEIVIVKKENLTQAPVLVDDFSWSTLEKEPPQPEESVILDNLDEDNNVGADPFDTAYVETIIRRDSLEDDDFDPRAEESKEPIEETKPVVSSLTVKQKDLLSGSCTDLTDLSHIPVIQASESIEKEYDPFDTSGISSIVQPKETEIKFLEKELLSDSGLKHSISDPDFDPRAEEKESLSSTNSSLAERKSSLSLNIAGPLSNQKTVVFAVSDSLAAEHEAKPHKPLTPYYSKKPIDASDNQGSDISDSEFNPRAISPVSTNKPDLLCVDNVHETKVLTPATDINQSIEETTVEDPFDTSNVSGLLLPGKAELKLIENELIATVEKAEIAVLDTNSDSQELGLGAKVLTPQVTLPSDNSLDEVDPFDTSFAANLAPGKAEIKVLESELIHK